MKAFTPDTSVPTENDTTTISAKCRCGAAPAQVRLRICVRGLLVARAQCQAWLRRPNIEPGDEEAPSRWCSPTGLRQISSSISSAQPKVSGYHTYQRNFFTERAKRYGSKAQQNAWSKMSLVPGDENVVRGRMSSFGVGRRRKTPRRFASTERGGEDPGTALPSAYLFSLRGR